MGGSNVRRRVRAGQQSCEPNAGDFVCRAAPPVGRRRHGHAMAIGAAATVLQLLLLLALLYACGIIAS
jgi:hypothetical protein